MTGLKDAQLNLTTFALDAVNRVTSQTDPNGKSTTFLFNAAGLMTSTTDRDGRVRNLAYDLDNHLTTETWLSGGVTVNILTFTYDNLGSMLTAANNNGAYTMTLNADERVTVVQEPFGLTLTMTYDGVGNRTLVQDSKNGVTTSVYDGANNLTSRQFGGTGLTPLRFDLTYTGTNQISTEIRYSNLAGTATVATSTFLYDLADKVTSINHQNSGGTSLASFLSTWDAADRVTGATENGALKTYTYDNINELTGDGVNTLTFDAEGNRTNTGYSTTTGNEMTSDGTNNYQYDNEGNITSKTNIATGDQWTYSVDNLNHLVGAVDKTSTGLLETQATYLYDVFGNRIEKIVTSGGTTTTMEFAQDGWKTHLDALGQVMAQMGNENWDTWADLDGSNNLQTRYLRGDVVDQLFAREDSAGNVYWTLTDRLGSIRTVIDNSANVKDQIFYDGWGNPTGTNSFAGRYLWTGRDYDTETNLQYNRARTYDPHTGRWLSQDPLGFDAGDSNLYRYVKNNPINNLDPTGLNPFEVENGTMEVFSGRATESKPGSGIQSLIISFKRGDASTLFKDGKFKVKQYMLFEVFGIFRCPKKIFRDEYETWQLPPGLNLDPGGGEKDHEHPHESGNHLKSNLWVDHGGSKNGFAKNLYYLENKNDVRFTDEPTAPKAVFKEAVKRVQERWKDSFWGKENKDCCLESVRVVQYFVSVVYLVPTPIKTIQWTATLEGDVEGPGGKGSPSLGFPTTKIIGTYPGTANPYSIVRGLVKADPK